MLWRVHFPLTDPLKGFTKRFNSSYLRKKMKITNDNSTQNTNSHFWRRGVSFNDFNFERKHKLRVLRYAFIVAFILGMVGIQGTPFVPHAVLASNVVYQRTTTGLFSIDTADNGSGEVAGYFASGTLVVDISNTWSDFWYADHIYTDNNSETHNNNNNGTGAFKAVLYDENDNYVASSSNSNRLTYFTANTLFTWNFNNEAIPTKFKMKLLNVDGVQAGTHTSINNINMVGTWSQSSSTSQSAYANITIPTDGQLLNDFNKWTITAKNTYASTTLRVIVYNDAGTYQTEALENDFVSSVLQTRNYDKQTELSNGQWYAKAQLYDNASSVIRFDGTWIHFNITGQFETPCNTTSTGWFDLSWDDAKCNFMLSVRNIKNSVTADFQSGISSTISTGSKIFPISMFVHVNTLLNQVSASSSAGFVVKLPNGQNVPLLTTSTIDQASTIAGINIRTLANSTLYLITAIIVIWSSWGLFL